MLEAGQKIPAFKLPDESGDAKKLADFAGDKGVVIYVYPRDKTPGCTTESQEFTELLPQFEAAGYKVVGLSKDSVKSHCSFIEKYDLKVSLISDPDGQLVEGLGAWGEKKMYGRTSMGIIRSTFVADKKGKLKLVYPKVRAKGHAAQVLADIEAL